LTVLVSHPGMQHAHQLAMALHADRQLEALWSGVPVRNSGEKWVDVWNLFGERLRDVNVASMRRRHPVWFPLARRFCGGVLQGFLGKRSLALNFDVAFDNWVARRLYRTRASVVVAHEEAAEKTFSTAKSLGIVTVLNAASLWDGALAKRGDAPRHSFGPRVKDRELSIADYVITCSPLATESYAAAGYPRERIFTLALGANVEQNFRAHVGNHDTCRFVFLGAVSVAKGFDLLLSAFESSNISDRATLSVFGVCNDSALLARMKRLSRVSYHGVLPATEVFQRLATHDCLVLPSRRDGFGMVVTEALAVGLPVVVSRSAGACCIIDDFPLAGRVVDCDANSLRSVLNDIAEHPEWLIRASAEALCAANAYSWKVYADRAVAIFKEIGARNRLVKITSDGSNDDT
jgi:glycosyltransferase involved in cell wall biosynthesis